MANKLIRKISIEFEIVLLLDYAKMIYKRD